MSQISWNSLVLAVAWAEWSRKKNHHHFWALTLKAVLPPFYSSYAICPMTQRMRQTLNWNPRPSDCQVWACHSLAQDLHGKRESTKFTIRRPGFSSCRNTLLPDSEQVLNLWVKENNDAWSIYLPHRVVRESNEPKERWEKWGHCKILCRHRWLICYLCWNWGGRSARLRTSGLIFKIALDFGDIFRNHWNWPKPLVSTYHV